MASYKQLQIISMICILKQSYTLDFDSAVKNGRFQEITKDSSFTMNPSSDPSVSMYYDHHEESDNVAKENQSSRQNAGASLIFDLNQMELHDDDFTIGLSVVFLKFDAPSRGSVRVTVDREYYGQTYKDEEISNSHNKTIVHITQNIPLPDERIEENNIIRSYDQASLSCAVMNSLELHSVNQNTKGPDALELKSVRMTIDLLDWEMENSIYFTVTSYMIGKEGMSECEGYR